MVILLLLMACIDFYAEIPCSSAENCPEGYSCGASGMCVEVGGISDCPEDIVVDFGSFQMDAYEASRADAGPDSAGSDDSVACSAPGVIPWRPESVEVAEGACLAAGKRLCSSEELETACRGSVDVSYPYGDEHQDGACNDESGAGELAPTGSFPDCVESTGKVFDLVGNLAETCGYCLGDGSAGVHGGGFMDSHEWNAECGRVNNANFSSDNGAQVGFRCCI